MKIKWLEDIELDVSIYFETEDKFDYDTSFYAKDEISDVEIHPSSSIPFFNSPKHINDVHIKFLNDNSIAYNVPKNKFEVIQD